MSKGDAVAIEGLSKRYQTGHGSITALDEVSLSIPASTAIGVVGPSGSGKSTLLHVVGAMDLPDEGRVRVGDVEVTTLDRKQQVAYRRTIGFVFQHFHLLPVLTALDNVAAPVLPRDTDFDKLERAAQLLAAVGLAGREDALPSRLSGGEQQRVAIARALINEPRLLLADEPTGNLDTHTGGEIVDLLLRLRDERGMTLIVATHNQLVAARCDRVVRLLDGRVVDQIDVAGHEEPEAVLERISRIEP
jgi:putative ABC transport system ATP-binding protein